MGSKQTDRHQERDQQNITRMSHMTGEKSGVTEDLADEAEVDSGTWTHVTRRWVRLEFNMY